MIFNSYIKYESLEEVYYMVRLKDIAEKTGYSINTVSMALNNRDGCVSQKAREAIEACAMEMGYVGSFSALKIRSGKSMVLALIIDDLINPFFSAIADDIILYAYKYGYTVNVFTTNGEESRERWAVSAAVSHKVDGVIIMPLQNTNVNIDLLYKNDIPFVLLGRAFNEFGSEPGVTYDEIRCGYMAAEYLLFRGHSEIAVLNSEKNIYINECRNKGMRAAFEAHGKNFNEDFIYNIPLNIHSRPLSIKENICKLMDKTAIICYDDIIALEIVEQLKMFGKKVPEDISLISFGNVFKYIPAVPRITTIDTCEGSISIEAVDMMMKILSGEKVEKKILPVSIVEGNSVLNIRLNKR